MKLRYTFTGTADVDPNDYHPADLNGMSIAEYQQAGLMAFELDPAEILEDVEDFQVTVVEVDES